MTVVGVGIDLVELVRAERLLLRHGERALARLLTSAERDYVRGHQTPVGPFAARLAAKEASWKALQALPGAAGVGWRDLEVLRHLDGRPAIRFHGLAEELARQYGPLTLHLSLTHTHAAAAAVAVLTRVEPRSEPR